MAIDKTVRQELAEKVSSYLFDKKNILEVVLKSQLSTEKPKYLELYSPDRTTRVYSESNEIRAVVNSDGDVDWEAIKKINFETFSFDDVVDEGSVEKSISIKAGDLVKRSGKNFLTKKVISACKINETSTAPYKSNLPLPHSEIIEFTKGLSKIFDYSEIPEQIDFQFRRSCKVCVKKEENNIVVICSKINS